RSVFLRVALAILVLRPLHDVERLGDAPAVLVGGPLDVFVRDVRLAHLEVGVHASARQAHVDLLLGYMTLPWGRGVSRRSSLRRARVGCGSESTSMAPTSAASSRPMIPGVMFRRPAVANESSPLIRYTMSNTTPADSRPRGRTMSIGWMGWPASFRRLSKGSS